MKVNKLRIVDFRNYEDIEVQLHPGINVLFGINGQGKTNFVEAINYLSSLKSFRISNDLDLIRTGKDSFIIDGEVEVGGNSRRLKVVQTNVGRTLFIDKKEAKRNLDFNELFHSLIFSPLDVTLFIDLPERRRKFIDKELAKISPAYAFTLSRFKNILKERNAMLKEQVDRTYLDVLTRQISELSDYIVDKRMEFIAELSKHADKVFRNLYDSEEFGLDIEYLTYRLSTSEEAYYSVLNDDIIRQKTTIGPHYDDIRVNLKGLDIAKFGSQGQQRLATLALKLGLLEVYKLSRVDKVVVILDDVLSELDDLKRAKIFNYFEDDYQVFITSANLADIKRHFGQQIHCYEVNNGTIKEKNI